MICYQMSETIFHVFKSFFLLFYLELCPVNVIKISVCHHLEWREFLPLHCHLNLLQFLYILRHTMPYLLLQNPWNLCLSLFLLHHYGSMKINSECLLKLSNIKSRTPLSSRWNCKRTKSTEAKAKNHKYVLNMLFPLKTDIYYDS